MDIKTTPSFIAFKTFIQESENRHSGYRNISPEIVCNLIIENFTTEIKTFIENSKEDLKEFKNFILRLSHIGRLAVLIDLESKNWIPIFDAYDGPVEEHDTNGFAEMIQDTNENFHKSETRIIIPVLSYSLITFTNQYPIWQLNNNTSIMNSHLIY